jgi:tRNA 2-thiouridine synthesizing protein A
MDDEATVVDARGHRCPVPTLRLQRALVASDRVLLLADDPLARIDVPHFAGQAGCDVLKIEDAVGGGVSFLVARRP